MIEVISAIVISAVLYFILDKVSIKKELPRTTGHKIATFVFLFVISFTVIYFTRNALRDSGMKEHVEKITHKSYDIDMIKNIPENIQVGLAPF